MRHTTMEPETIAIEKTELERWLMAAEAGITPTVEYLPGEDRLMLDNAYEKRGEKLKYIATRLHALLR